MKKFVTWFIKEWKALLPTIVYFFVALQIVAFVRRLMEQAHGVNVVPVTASILVASLILGKAVMIADLLPVINRFPEKPLAYNVAWKTTIYLTISLALHYLERLIEHWRATGSFAEANHELFAAILWPQFWALQIVLCLLILWYVVLHEIGRLLGQKTMFDLFFGTLTAVKADIAASQPEKT